MRLLIVDDEPLARARLRALLNDVAPRIARATPANPATDAELALDIDEAASADEAFRQLAIHPVDAVLLDIRMPGMDGLALAQVLRETAAATAQRPPHLIFVTAHADHALQAFDLAAVDYLTKPVRRDRLVEALQRVVARLSFVPSGDAETGTDAVLIAHDRGRIVRIPAGDILHLKAELKYVSVRTASAVWLVDESLSELESRLGRRFLRIHRNALVAVTAIRCLMPGLEVPESHDNVG